MLLELISRGGPVMYILLACSFVSLAIILERGWFWLTQSKKMGNTKLCYLIAEGLDEKDKSLKGNTFFQNVSELKKRGENEKLARLLEKQSARSYESGIKNLNGLDTVISIAPLLGILGTVMGIMKSFHALDLQHMTSPGEVGHGLAEAMISTATGLAIAVPSLVFYNLFNSLATQHSATIYKLSEDLDQSCSKENEGCE